MKESKIWINGERYHVHGFEDSAYLTCQFFLELDIQVWYNSYQNSNKIFYRYGQEYSQNLYGKVLKKKNESSQFTWLWMYFRASMKTASGDQYNNQWNSIMNPETYLTHKPNWLLTEVQRQVSGGRAVFCGKWCWASGPHGHKNEL